MSKVILYIILLVILFSSLLPMISPTYASANCTTGPQIVYIPSYFPENTPIILNFSIRNSNVANQLNGKKVRLHFITPLLPRIGDYNSDSVTITGNSFSITASGYSWPVFHYDTWSPGAHEAVLDWEENPGSNNWKEFCQDIRYQVGAGGGCTLGSLPDRVPPGASLDVKFFGKVSTNYYLYVYNNSITITPIINVGEWPTNSQGQGVFHDVKFNASDGTKLNVRVCSSRIIGGCNNNTSCSKDVTVTITAPPPPAPQPGDVLPPGATLPGTSPVPVGQPTLGGGDPCDNGTGIKTAIGCIHTNPQEFVKDFMNFAIGIGGGFAFLMMLLGAFQMLTSAGNPDALKAGQDRLTNAVIGLLFVIFAVLLIQIIGLDILRIPGFS